MTLDEVKAEVKKIKQAKNGNYIFTLTDKLKQDFIEAIATGKCEDYIDCAQEIIKLWKQTSK